ncbi:MAG: heme ABC transporter ATP-binding protein [Acidimicrobiales bacterium]
MSALVATGLAVRRARRTVLSAVELEVRRGEVMALVGPNGAGKSTLLAALAGDLRPVAGEVVLGGRPLASWSIGDLSRERAVLPQQHAVTFAFTAGEVVRMGRTPWRGRPEAGEDDDAIAAAMAATDTTALAAAPFGSLSGGEQARVALARVLAQRVPIVLLDEPTASLDLRHQVQVFRVARARAADGDAVVVVVHDLSLAAAHADRLVLLDDGRVVADAPPDTVLTPDRLSDVYGCEIDVVTHPVTGAPLVVAGHTHRRTFA